MVYKGCKIFKSAFVTRNHPETPYIWEEMIYGAESEDAFATIEEAKADIDKYFGLAPAPRVIDNEIYT